MESLGPDAHRHEVVIGVRVQTRRRPAFANPDARQIYFAARKKRRPDQAEIPAKFLGHPEIPVPLVELRVRGSGSEDFIIQVIAKQHRFAVEAVGVDPGCNGRFVRN